MKTEFNSTGEKNSDHLRGVIYRDYTMTKSGYS